VSACRANLLCLSSSAPRCFPDKRFERRRFMRHRHSFNELILEGLTKPFLQSPGGEHARGNVLEQKPQRSRSTDGRRPTGTSKTTVSSVSKREERAPCAARKEFGGFLGEGGLFLEIHGLSETSVRAENCGGIVERFKFPVRPRTSTILKRVGWNRARAPRSRISSSTLKTSRRHRPRQTGRLGRWK